MAWGTTGLKGFGLGLRLVSVSLDPLSWLLELRVLDFRVRVFV